ncbi:phosphate acyltransferase PlsX [Acetoanaerobium noterae]|uniref:phosphate acyltransferase PlsX n=1 Tax=Acetoanaerobium noterae TaxID=745369 RepID=UPI0028ADCE98|nr:phosphate acyltransferase PlsX [Acetoanaerobium noterae]
MKIALDVMGGDNAPKSNIDGAIEAIKELNIEIILLGDSAQIQEIMPKDEALSSKMTVVHCDETITFDEKPVKAVRTKKKSSIVVGLNMLKNNEVDAFVSAGSTGAILAGGLFVVGRIKGIDRPALTGVFPNENGGSLIMDIGANADCKPKNLDEFAMMGSIYAQNILGRKNPKVALVNIGSEEGKGNELYKTAFELMKANAYYNFVGNIEAREIPTSKVDVIVCDGFTGNIIIKLTEGIASRFFDMLKKVMFENIKTKFAALMLKKSLYNMKKELDADEQGGVPLLGIDGIIIKAHGSSKAKAIKNAIKQAIKFHESNSLTTIKDYAKKHVNNDII